MQQSWVPWSDFLCRVKYYYTAAVSIILQQSWVPAPAPSVMCHDQPETTLSCVTTLEQVRRAVWRSPLVTVRVLLLTTTVMIVSWKWTKCGATNQSMLTKYHRKKMNKHLEHDFHLLIIQTDFLHFLIHYNDIHIFYFDGGLKRFIKPKTYQHQHTFI